MTEERRQSSRSRIDQLVESGQITLLPAPPDVSAAQEYETVTFSRTTHGHQADRLEQKGQVYWVVLLDEGAKDVYGDFIVRHKGPVNGIKYQDPAERRGKRSMSMSNELEFTILQSQEKGSTYFAFFNQPSED